MKLKFEQSKSQNKYYRYLMYAIIGLFIALIQTWFLNFIEVGGFTPDFILIFVVWIAVVEGRLTGLFVGFAAGLLIDYISFDHLGTNALAKTVAAFIAGTFSKPGKESNTLSDLSFIFLVFGISVVHNLIYFFFYLQISEFDFFYFFIKFGLAHSIYTTVFSALGMLLRLPIKRF